MKIGDAAKNPSPRLRLRVLYQADITKRDAALVWKILERRRVRGQEVKEFSHRLAAGVGKITTIDAMISKYATNWQLRRMAIIDRNV